jgi:Fe-S-cluster containining protein
MTNDSEWGEIAGHISPTVLTIAAGRSVSRLEQVHSGLSSIIIQSNRQELRSLLPPYMDKFNKSAGDILIDSQIIDFVTKEQTTFEDQNFTPFEAASNTKYLRSAVSQPEWNQDMEQVRRITYLLTSAVSNIVRSTNEPLDRKQVVDMAAFALNPNKEDVELACPFLNVKTGKCVTYDHKPGICDHTGSYYPKIKSCSGCSPNYIYCALRNAPTMDETEYRQIWGENLLKRVRKGSPLEFYIVREMAARNADFASNPVGFISGIEVPKRRRH